MTVTKMGQGMILCSTVPSLSARFSSHKLERFPARKRAFSRREKGCFWAAYHVMREGHFKSGVDDVPEPFASIYFPYFFREAMPCHGLLLGNLLNLRIIYTLAIFMMRKSRALNTIEGIKLLLFKLSIQHKCEHI